MGMKGIDVSYHQKKIDWNKVKNSGVEFAIIRAGYGSKQTDKKFIDNIMGANKAGLKTGVYWFIYAADVNAAVKNADKCHEVIKPYKDIIDMKAWADWEYDSDKRNPQTKESRTEIVKAFCERLKEYGYEVGVYANPDYIKRKFGDLSKYPLWVAKYGKNNGEMNAKYQPQIEGMIGWQYTSKGYINGINGNVDMDVWYEELSSSNRPTEAYKGNPYKEPRRLLYKKRIMMRGDDVKWLQNELVRHNCLSAKNAKGKTNIDGIFGKDTDAAVRKFQDSVGITVDGKVGVVTRKYLKA